jgi:anthranilate synthase/aminodeoxychorismate synthase-like glutamine amidotransferase
MSGILLIDNYDSFTYNLYQYFGELGVLPEVVRNDEASLDALEMKNPGALVISPGPCTPKEAGVSIEAVRRFSGRIPILGVCLGHQAIAEAFGGKVVLARRLMHGKTSMVFHDGLGVFKEISSPFRAVRYHSLIVDAESLPQDLEIPAVSEYNEPMAIRHRSLPVFGVQFHPESILTEHGHQLLRNFLELI